MSSGKFGGQQFIVHRLSLPQSQLHFLELPGGSLLTLLLPSLTFSITDHPAGALNKIQALPRPMGPT